MRVLLLNHNVAYTGGATFYRALHLGRGLAQRGNQVTLIASSASTMFNFYIKEEGGLQIVQAPGMLPTSLRYGYDPYETLWRIRWLSRRTYDIIHAFDSRPVVIYPALSARRKAGRLVMDWCDWFGRGGAAEQRTNPFRRVLMRRLDTYYEEKFRKLADATTVINTALEQRAIELGVPGHSILRLPNGADPARIYPVEIETARQAMGIPAEGLLLGYLGSLFAADAGLLLEAFALVRQAFPQAKLLFIGEPKSDISQGEGVLRTGFLSYGDLNQALGACNILLLPMTGSQANHGRWPSKIGDYFAAGRPIVACAVGDIQDILPVTGSGLLSRPNAEAFAGQIIRLITDPALRARMGASARRAAETDYNWATLVGKVESLYSGLLASGE